MRIMAKRFLCLLFIFVLYSSAFGGAVAPPPVNDVISVSPTLKKDPAQEIRLGDFLAKFEKTTLGEIKYTVGSGSIRHSGDAGGSQYWLCYSLPGQRVWLISHGEMGGSNHALTQVHAISTDTELQANDMCPMLPKNLQPISFPFGWIGTDKEDLYQVLGKPSGIQEGNHIYLYEGKENVTRRGQSLEFYVLGYVEAKVVDGKIAKIYASHVTSN